MPCLTSAVKVDLLLCALAERKVGHAKSSVIILPRLANEGVAKGHRFAFEGQFVLGGGLFLCVGHGDDTVQRLLLRVNPKMK